MRVSQRLLHYAHLMRLNRPIPILLLLWPTLWAVWLASHGQPHWHMVLIFVLGSVIMRTAGCVINDIADRQFDGQVRRTAMRPLATGVISVWEAQGLAILLLGAAAGLLLWCNRLTVLLAGMGGGLTMIYPFLKRITHFPQLGIGVSFMWGIPMAFAAFTGTVSASAWLLFLAGVVWVVAYDTLYAMADRADDLRIGIKSTAILFGHHDRVMLVSLHGLALGLLAGSGVLFRLGCGYYVSLGVVGLLFAYQHYLIRTREPLHCLRAFLNNHWVGGVIFLGIVISQYSH